jgi:hypothetical protein
LLSGIEYKYQKPFFLRIKNCLYNSPTDSVPVCATRQELFAQQLLLNEQSFNRSLPGEHLPRRTQLKIIY